MFASNGDGFVFHDKTLKDGEGDIEKTLTLDEFPSPAQLWEKYRVFKGLSSSPTATPMRRGRSSVPTSSACSGWKARGQRRPAPDSKGSRAKGRAALQSVLWRNWWLPP